MFQGRKPIKKVHLFPNNVEDIFYLESKSNYILGTVCIYVFTLTTRNQMIQVFARNSTTCVLCFGCPRCVFNACDSQPITCTAPAVFRDFCSVGSLRKTMGFARGWGGFNPSSKGNSEGVSPCTFIQSWKITSELKDISRRSLKAASFW